jgi:hypothetical protein
VRLVALKPARGGSLAVILVAVFVGAVVAPPAASAATFAPCALSEKDQAPPGGTAAFGLTVAEHDTTCATATTVMKAFHRCRTDGGTRCARPAIGRWRCTATRADAGPRGLPKLFRGRLNCAAGNRGVRSGYWEIGPKCFGATARDPERPCFNPTRTVTPTLEEVEPLALEPGAAGCDPGVVAGACVWGGADAAHSTRNIALVGDSHAYHWRGALALVAQVKRWAAYSIDAGGCFFSDVVAAFIPECVPTFYNPVLNWFRAHPEVDTVFVTSNADTPVAVPEGQTYTDYKAGGFERAWRALPKTVKHIIVLRDTTITTQETFDCVARVAAAPSGRPGPSCPLARSIAIREDTGVAAVKALHNKRYQYIDLTRYLCGARDCYPVIGGVRVNGDIYGHLNVTFSRTLGPYLLRAIRKLERSW